MNNKKLKSRLGKNNAISLICYDMITPDVYKLYKKWAKDKRLTVTDARLKHLGRYVYQIEFVGDISLLEDDLRKIDPRFLKKLSVIKRIIRQIKRQKNIYKAWLGVKISNMKDDFEDWFCYYIKAPIYRLLKRSR